MSTETTREPRTIDMTNPRWGHDTSLSTKDAGQTLTGFMWATPRPHVGDYVILATRDPAKPSTRYQIEEADWTVNVDDMYAVVLKFAPRTAVTEVAR